MAKKFFVMGVAMIMVFGLFTGCGIAKGSFYSLQAAYENGWLTQEDLKTLAYYWNGESDDENFTPKPKTPETLDAKTEKAMRHFHFSQSIDKREHPFATAKGVYISNYWGVYEDCVVVGTQDNYRQVDILYLEECIVGGVVFIKFAPSEMKVWRET